jgi:hypothetical protein
MKVEKGGPFPALKGAFQGCNCLSKEESKGGQSESALHSGLRAAHYPSMRQKGIPIEIWTGSAPVVAVVF